MPQEKGRLAESIIILLRKGCMSPAGEKEKPAGFCGVYVDFNEQEA